MVKSDPNSRTGGLLKRLIGMALLVLEPVPAKPKFMNSLKIILRRYFQSPNQLDRHDKILSISFPLNQLPEEPLRLDETGNITVVPCNAEMNRLPLGEIAI